MKIAVFSDIHDNTTNLDKALAASTDCNALFFCGDFCAPFTLKQIADQFTNPVHVVFGNNDGDKFLMSQIAAQQQHIILHGELASLEIAGLKIAANHYPQIARQIALAGEHDVVLYGHDHQYKVRREGTSLLINPGEIMGRFGEPSIIILDTETQATQRVLL